MEKITKTFNVYEFDELNEDIRQKLIESERQAIKEEFYEWYLYDCLYDEASKLVVKYFGNNAKLNKIYYSLNYRQGDGAMIEFEGTYNNKPFRVIHKGHYCHKYSFDIDSYDFTMNEFEKLKLKVLKMNTHFENIAWTIVEFEPSEEEIIDSLNENKYLKDGTIFED